MSPSAVKAATGLDPSTTYKFDFGHFKDIDAVQIDRDAETGKTGGNAAKVSKAHILAFGKTN